MFFCFADRREFNRVSRRAVSVALLAVAALTPIVRAQSAAGAQIPFPTRQSLLEAAQSGQLVGLGQATAGALQPVVASVHRILTTEYKVPPISKECFDSSLGFTTDVRVLMRDVTAMHVSTLGDKPPEFVNDTGTRDMINARVLRYVETMLSARDRTVCDGQAQGKVVLHPYKKALFALVKDYSKATQAYIEGERARRRSAYQQEAAGKQQQEQQRQAESRAAEQQRIDAETARVKQDEQRRVQKEKSRIGG